MSSTLRPSRVLIAGTVAAVGLLVVGWFDYTLTRRDLLQLLRQQAVTLHQTIAAAARTNQAAGAPSRPASLGALTRDVVAANGQLAYAVIDLGALHIVNGDLPSAEEVPAGRPVVGAPAGLLEREVVVDGKPVLEVSGAFAFGDGGAATLRVGVRLDEVRAAERRIMVRLALSLAAALALSLIVLGTLWLREAYRAISLKHALAQAALVRRDRLIAMGDLASTVAHEVRGPLDAIAGAAERLRREYPSASRIETDEDRTEIERLLGAIGDETRRIGQVVRQFLEFAHPPTINPLKTELSADVRDVVESLRPLADSREVLLDLDVSTAGPAVVDSAQLRLAIHNLVRNAVEATPAKGRVSIAASSGAKGHTVEVRDTGAGIAPEDLPRIFDLYFTTKADGTGVGLAVSQQIVSAHGGTIEVASAPQRGTTMTVHLPLELREGAGAS